VSHHDLADQHRQLLEDSAVSTEVAAERGYWTATRKAELETLGFKRYQQTVPALVIPFRDARGRIVNYQIRPDQPRIGDNGKPVKYESPAGIVPTLDVPPRCRDRLHSPHSPLWISEGARKADAATSAGLCCVSLPGVWSWVKRLNGDARQVLPDLQRVKFEDRKVIVAFDSDVMVKPQVHKALEAFNTYLLSQGAIVSFCYLPELEPGVKCGLDDFLAAHPVEELWQYVEGGLRPAPEPKEKRKPALPAAVLLGAVEKLLRRYVHFPDDHGPTALALYVLHTWAIDAVRVTPYIYVKSPQKRSGKTRTLEALELVCRSPLRAASITEAALYQAVEALRPTLLIDEVDAIFTQKNDRAEALRGVLNAGNARGAKVVRGTQDGSPQISETFCCKVLSGIDTGKLPDTIRDRAIVIGLERKKRTELVERFRVDDIADQLDQLRERLEDWAAADREELADYRCETIAAISERLEEAWEPLLGIAALAGGAWPQRARQAVQALAAGAEDPGEDHGPLLLAALKDIFAKHGQECDVMFTEDICAKLNEDDELPFGGYRKDQGINGRGLSAKLKPYGIKPKNVRIVGDQSKGYRREWFLELWERYVCAEEAAEVPSQASHRPTTPANPVVERDPGGTDSGTPSVHHPSHLNPAFQSPNGDAGTPGRMGRQELPPSAHTHNGWTPEAASAFIEKAKEVFPGSVELPLEGEGAS
jgi:Protein of unknown function (DUF3631)/Domain of unknown function (DUF3854)